jgi:hypothetical protein
MTHTLITVQIGEEARTRRITLAERWQSTGVGMITGLELLGTLRATRPISILVDELSSPAGRNQEPTDVFVEG